MKYLLVANQTLGGQRLRDTLRQLRDPDMTVHLVVPATAAHVLDNTLLLANMFDVNPYKASPSVAVRRKSEESGRKRATYRLREGLGMLEDERITATGQVGDADPLQAIQDAFTRDDYDHIIVSTLHRTSSHWLRMDLPARAHRKFHVPVTHVEGTDHVGSRTHARLRPRVSADPGNIAPGHAAHPEPAGRPSTL